MKLITAIIKSMDWSIKSKQSQLQQTRNEARQSEKIPNMNEKEENNGKFIVDTEISSNDFKVSDYFSLHSGSLKQIENNEETLKLELVLKKLQILRKLLKKVLSDFNHLLTESNRTYCELCIKCHEFAYKDDRNQLETFDIIDTLMQSLGVETMLKGQRKKYVRCKDLMKNNSTNEPKNCETVKERELYQEESTESSEDLTLSNLEKNFKLTRASLNILHQPSGLEFRNSKRTKKAHFFPCELILFLSMLREIICRAQEITSAQDLNTQTSLRTEEQIQELKEEYIGILKYVSELIESPKHSLKRPSVRRNNKQIIVKLKINILISKKHIFEILYEMCNLKKKLRKYRSNLRGQNDLQSELPSISSEVLIKIEDICSKLKDSSISLESLQRQNGNFETHSWREKPINDSKTVQGEARAVVKQVLRKKISAFHCSVETMDLDRVRQKKMLLYQEKEILASFQNNEKPIIREKKISPDETRKFHSIRICNIDETGNMSPRLQKSDSQKKEESLMSIVQKSESMKQPLELDFTDSTVDKTLLTNREHEILKKIYELLENYLKKSKEIDLDKVKEFMERETLRYSSELERMCITDNKVHSIDQPKGSRMQEETILIQRPKQRQVFESVHLRDDSIKCIFKRAQIFSSTDEEKKQPNQKNEWKNYYRETCPQEIQNSKLKQTTQKYYEPAAFERTSNSILSQKCERKDPELKGSFINQVNSFEDNYDRSLSLMSGRRVFERKSGERDYYTDVDHGNKPRVGNHELMRELKRLEMIVYCLQRKAKRKEAPPKNDGGNAENYSGHTTTDCKIQQFRPDFQTNKQIERNNQLTEVKKNGQNGLQPRTESQQTEGANVKGKNDDNHNTQDIYDPLPPERASSVWDQHFKHKDTLKTLNIEKQEITMERKISNINDSKKNEVEHNFSKQRLQSILEQNQHTLKVILNSGEKFERKIKFKSKSENNMTGGTSMIESTKFWHNNPAEDSIKRQLIETKETSDCQQNLSKVDRNTGHGKEKRDYAVQTNTHRSKSQKFLNVKKRNQNQGGKIKKYRKNKQVTSLCENNNVRLIEKDPLQYNSNKSNMKLDQELKSIGVTNFDDYQTGDANEMNLPLRVTEKMSDLVSMLGKLDHFLSDKHRFQSQIKPKITAPEATEFNSQNLLHEEKSTSDGMKKMFNFKSNKLQNLGRVMNESKDMNVEDSKGKRNHCLPTNISENIQAKQTMFSVRHYHNHLGSVQLPIDNKNCSNLVQQNFGILQVSTENLVTKCRTPKKQDENNFNQETFMKVERELASNFYDEHVNNENRQRGKPDEWTRLLTIDNIIHTKNKVGSSQEPTSDDDRTQADSERFSMSRKAEEKTRESLRKIDEEGAPISDSEENLETAETNYQYVHTKLDALHKKNLVSNLLFKETRIPPPSKQSKKFPQRSVIRQKTQSSANEALREVYMDCLIGADRKNEEEKEKTAQDTFDHENRFDLKLKTQQKKSKDSEKLSFPKLSEEESEKDTTYGRKTQKCVIKCSRQKINEKRKKLKKSNLRKKSRLCEQPSLKNLRQIVNLKPSKIETKTEFLHPTAHLTKCLIKNKKFVYEQKQPVMAQFIKYENYLPRVPAKVQLHNFEELCTPACRKKTESKKENCTELKDKEFLPSTIALNEKRKVELLQRDKKPALVLQNRPMQLYNYNGLPLTDLKGNPLRNVYGRSLVRFSKSQRPISNLEGNPVFDSKNRPNTSSKFNPYKKYRENPFKIQLTNEQGKPLILFNEAGYPMTDGKGYSLFDISGNPLIRFDSCGRPISDYKGNSLLMASNSEMRTEKDEEAPLSISTSSGGLGSNLDNSVVSSEYLSDINLSTDTQKSLAISSLKTIDDFLQKENLKELEMEGDLNDSISPVLKVGQRSLQNSKAELVGTEFAKMTEMYEFNVENLSRKKHTIQSSRCCHLLQNRIDPSERKLDISQPCYKQNCEDDAYSSNDFEDCACQKMFSEKLSKTQFDQIPKDNLNFNDDNCFGKSRLIDNQNGSANKRTIKNKTEDFPQNIDQSLFFTGYETATIFTLSDLLGI